MPFLRISGEKHIVYFAIICLQCLRWAVQDLLMKTSNYPNDLVGLYEREGVWRENFTLNKGGFIFGDMAHEQYFNLPLKGAIWRNRQNLNIIENIVVWLLI